MNYMKHKLLLYSIIILHLILVTGISAQSPKKILRRASKAIGGEKKLKSIRSFEKRGLITRLRDGANGDFTMRGVKPDKFNSIFDLRGFETELGFNGKSGWRRDSREGLRTLTGQKGDHFKAEAVYRNWRWVNYRKRKEKVSNGGQVTLNGKNTNVVILTNPKAVSIKLYFDTSTDLLVREEIPFGKELQTFNYSDYRPVNGVKEPFNIVTNLSGERFEIKLDQIVHNIQLAESIFNFPRTVGKPLPDIPKLLKEVRANEDKVENILDNYSYSQKVTKRKLDKKGILSVLGSETYQVSFHGGYRIRRLIAKDGKTLTQKQQRIEDKEVGKRVRRIEKRIAKEKARNDSRSSKESSYADGKPISFAEVLRASKLLNPRRERLLGRDIIVFDFEPDPSFDFKRAKSFLKVFGKTTGVMWIDAEDKQVARLEAVLFDSYKVGSGLLAKLRKGASFTMEKRRFNDEVWLPSFTDINLSIRLFLFGGLRLNQIVNYFDYRKFKTEVEDARVNDLKKP